MQNVTASVVNGAVNTTKGTNATAITNATNVTGATGAVQNGTGATDLTGATNGTGAIVATDATSTIVVLSYLDCKVIFPLSQVFAHQVQ